MKIKKLGSIFYRKTINNAQKKIPNETPAMISRLKESLNAY